MGGLGNATPMTWAETSPSTKNGRVLALGLALLLPLLACKLGKSEGDPETRPLPVVSGDGGTTAVQAEPPKVAEPKQVTEPAKKEETPEEAKPAAEKQTPTTKAPTDTKSTSEDSEEDDAEQDDAKQDDAKQDDVAKAQAALKKCIVACGQEMTKCLGEVQKGQAGDPAQCQTAMLNCQTKCRAKL